MTQVGEAIAFGGPASKWKCPFGHTKKPIPDIKNKWKNSSKKLGKNLISYTASNETPCDDIEITFLRKKVMVTYNPHHLLPGEASWPTTKLKKWIEKGKQVDRNLGYNVNEWYNGVWLPSSDSYAAVFSELWTDLEKNYSNGVDVQMEFAFDCMDGTARYRQFHDAHVAYNKFVIKVLDKIAEKLDQRTKGNTKSPGCNKANCQGNLNSKAPFAPPTSLLSRVKGVADRLELKLTCPPKRWEMPVYTSRFALAYQEGIDAGKAKEQLTQARIDVGKGKFF